MTRLLWSLLILLVTAFLILHFIAPTMLLRPTRSVATIVPMDMDLKVEDIMITTRDGLKLKAYWIGTQTDSSDIVVVFINGIGGNRGELLPAAKRLSQSGISSIVFDGRAHGVSEGGYCTFGYNEKKDISCFIDVIKERYPTSVVGVWGKSLGGAIGLQAMEVDQRIAFGVIESTFSELDDVVYDYGRRLSGGLIPKGITDYVLHRAGKIGGFSPDQVKPILSAQSIDRPVLIAHGDRDQRIDVTYGQALFDSLTSMQKELVIVPGAGHLNMHAVGGKSYFERVVNFIQSAV